MQTQEPVHASVDKLQRFSTAWKKSSTPASSQVSVEGAPQPSAAKKQTKMPLWKKKWFRVMLGVLAVLAVVGVLVGALAWRMYVQAMALRDDAGFIRAELRATYDAFKTQNLVEAKARLTAAQERMVAAEQKFQAFAWTGKLPVLGKYYQDGSSGFTAGLAGTSAGLKVIAAVEPHADVLGFSGEGTFTGGSTENRIALMLETLAQIQPALDGIAQDVAIIQESVSQIDPQDYPESFRGYEVRALVTQLHDLADGAELALNDARPVLEQLPAIAGADERRKYLVLFQNDNEQRPTGGFLTAYAVIFVEDGKITAEKSDDIYELDKKFNKKPPIPEKLGRFLVTEKRWNLRDMNIDPSFKASMDTFYSYYQDIPGEPQNIDGIIAVDTHLLEKVVRILGPVDVPGYGTFSAETLPRCDCPQIIYALSEIIDRPTPYIRENRKGILAPMMQSIIQKTYATSRDKWPQLAQLAWEGIEGRHIQMYFFDEDFQKAAESINAAGIIPQMPEDGGDYLTVIDANLAGAKSNLFVETSGKQTILSMANGRLEKQVELTYRNTHPPSNCNLEAGELCLNGLLNNWTRWYVPKGVEVTEVLGLEEGWKVDTANPNFDIIEGIFKLSPLSQARVRISYTVPYQVEEYILHMQKQGGTDAIPYTLITPWGQKEFSLAKDLVVRWP